MDMNASLSTQTFTTTDLGCVYDGMTDNSARLNAFLATASASNPLKLVIDQSIIAYLELSPNGYTTIEGVHPAVTITPPAGANRDVIRSQPYTGGYTEGQGVTTIPARNTQYITIRNLTINGGGATNATGNRTGVTPANVPIAGAPIHAVFSIAIKDCQHVLIEDVTFVNPPSYCVMIVNTNDFDVRHCNFTSAGTYQDGVHIDGPSEDGRVIGNTFAVGDDSTALNAPEGYGGDITDIIVADNIYNNCCSFVRVYNSIQGAPITGKVRRATFHNLQGTAFDIPFQLGIEGNVALGSVDQTEDILISGCTASCPNGFAIMRSTFGSINIVDCTYRAPTTTAPAITLNWTTFGDVTLRNFRVVRNPDGNAAPSDFVTLGVGFTVNRLTLDGIRVVDEVGTSYTAVPCLVDAQGTISSLILNDIDMTQISTIVSGAGWGNIAAVSGNGVLGTGVQVPDANMANGSMYLSATTGAPALKVNGTSQPVVTTGAALAPLFVCETPAGAVPGSTYTLSHTPSILIGFFANNAILRNGPDYTLSGTIITTTNPLNMGDIPYAVYLK